MDIMDQPIRITENLYQNYDLIGENNALDDEFDEYLQELEEAKEAVYEEDKNDEDYWDNLYQAFNQRHTNTNPPFPRYNVSSNHDITPPIRQNRNRTNNNNVSGSQDTRPIAFNPSGQYNLNFVDWENEWERAHEAMDNVDDDLEYIPGIASRDIQALYDAMVENEDENEGLKKDILKSLKIIQIKSKSKAKQLDT